MTTLHEGFDGNPRRRFLPEKEETLVIDTPALPGVAVYVLGPSRNKDVIRDMSTRNRNVPVLSEIEMSPLVRFPDHQEERCLW